MKVPKGVEAIFNKFPLVTNPQENVVSQTKTELLVYHVDEAGLAIEPYCLMAQAVLKLQKIEVEVKEASPFASQYEILPLLISPTRSSAGFASILKAKEISITPENETFMAMINRFINDAFVLSIVDNPTPFRAVYFQRKDKEHNSIVQAIITGDYQDHVLQQAPSRGDIVNYRAAKMAFKALSDRLGDSNFFSETTESECSDPNVVDIMTFAFVRCILSHLPQTPLAALIPQNLENHSHRVATSLMG